MILVVIGMSGIIRKIGLISVAIVVIVASISYVLVFTNSLNGRSDKMAIGITSDYGYGNYTGNLTNRTSAHPDLLQPLYSHATIHVSGKPNSTLEIGETAGSGYFLYNVGSATYTVIYFVLTARGSIISDLNPSSLTVGTYINGTKGDSQILQLMDQENGTNLNLDEPGFVVSGFGGSNQTMPFVFPQNNESMRNFTFDLMVSVEFIPYKGSIHNVQFYALINGLSKEVRTQIQFSFTEV